MIEQFDERGTDYFSLAGRTTLVAGTGYAAYKTANDLRNPMNRPVNPNRQTFQKQFNRIKDIKAPHKSAMVAALDTTPFEKILGDTRALYQDQRRRFSKTSTSLFSNMGTGYKGRSAALGKELGGLYQDMLGMGFQDLNVMTKDAGGGGVGQVRIFGSMDGRTMSFDVNPVTASGDIYTGQNLTNRMASRSVVSDFNIADDVSKSSVNIVGSDVALVQKYRSELTNIAAGTTDPRKLHEKMIGQSVYEGTRFGVSKQEGDVLSLMRKEQAIIDPFEEMHLFGKQATMKNLTQVPGYGAGSASQFAKGVVSTPESPLFKGIPGMEVSGTSYQYLRTSDFDSTVKPSIDWFGVKTGIGEFTHAYVPNSQLLEKATSMAGYDVGEIAAEELLMNKGKNVGIRNQLYTAKVSLDQGATGAAQNIINKVAEQVGVTTEELGKIISGPEGLAGMGSEKLAELDVDLTEEYKRLATKQDVLKTQLSTLNDLPIDHTTRRATRTGLIDELKGVQQDMREFEVFGVAEDMSSTSKLPGKEIQQKIVNMTVDKNNNLSIAMESHYKMGVGSKSFGMKQVVKAEVDTAKVLAYYEMLSVDPNADPSKYPGQLDDWMRRFQGVDIVGTEASVKMKEGVLEARRVPGAISSYFATGVATGSITPEQLSEFNIHPAEGGGYQYKGGQNFRDVLSKIEKNEGKALSEVLGGVKPGVSDISVSRVLMSPDVHAVQAGIGKAGTITERGAYYLESMGLNEFVTDIYSRAKRVSDPSAQLDMIEAALNPGKNVKGVIGAEALIAGGDLEDLFSTNMETRASMVSKIAEGKQTAYVQLGKSIKGMDRVPVFSQEALTPYIGKQIGSENASTSFDKASKRLIEASVDTNEGAAERLAVRHKEYMNELDKVKESIAKSIPKTKVRGSMYGQAASALDGLDGFQVAMTEGDIRNKFGKGALGQAKKGQLFGVVTREPIEGAHSVMPTQIKVAELGPEMGNMDGRVFIGRSGKMRSGLMIDFDKDTVNVVAAMGEKATDQIKAFMGRTGTQSDMGKEFYKSLDRMELLSKSFKGKAPINVLSEADNVLTAIAAEQKGLEKGAIGVVSNTFKDVHAGLREGLASGGGAKSFFLGEDFSHLFAENILKAKHQGLDILHSNALEALDVMAAKGKYASATAERRAKKMQEIFGALTGDIEDKAARTAMSEVASLDNLKNVIKAKDRGAKMGQNYLYKSMTSGLDSAAGVGGWVDEAIDISRQAMKRGLSNFAKWAILPTAAIGFAGSLMSKPKVLSPASEGGTKHESSDGGRERESVSHHGTIYSIPEAPSPGFSLRGTANANTNLSALKSMSSGMNDVKINMSDHRSKPDKYRLQELIDKGY